MPDLHYNDNFFIENYSLIFQKSKNIKEVKTKINRDEVKKLYDSGLKQIEICKIFNPKKGTIR